MIMMNILRQYIVVSFLSAFLFLSCSDNQIVIDKGDNGGKPDTDETPIVFRHDHTSDISYSAARLRFTIVEGNRNTKARGVAYSLSQDAGESAAKISATTVTGSGQFDVDLTDLSAGRTYYVRPFVEKNGKVEYGEQISFETVAYPIPTIYIDSMTFSDQARFEKYWNMLYPWGTDHNGSARMYVKQVSIESDNILKIKAERTEIWEGYSTADPWLRIFYHSGAIHAKQQITVNDAKPYWVISGDFKVPTMVGSWPAFWITGAWTWPPEIDIMEFKGNNTNWQNTVTGPDWQNTSWQTVKTVVADADEWHNYKLVIYKTSSSDVTADLFVDGEKKATHTADFVGKPFWLIINMQMEGASGGHATGPQYAEMQGRNVYLAAYDVIP